MTENKLPIRKAGDGPNSAPADLTKNVAARMLDDYQFDPLKESIRVAKGEALTKDHPLLPYLLDLFTNWRKRIAVNGNITTTDIDRLEEKCELMLTDSWVSPELRSRHIIDLMGYIASKKKAVEHIHQGSINHTAHELPPLDEQEILDFKQGFNDEYSA